MAISGFPSSAHKSLSYSTTLTSVTADTSCLPALARHSYLPESNSVRQGRRSLATVSPRLALPSSRLKSRCGTNRSSLYQAIEGAGEPVAEQVRMSSPVWRASTRAGGTVFSLTCSQWLWITMELAVDMLNMTNTNGSILHTKSFNYSTFIYC